MGTFSALLALCAGNSPVTGEFPSQRPVTRSFDVFLDLRLNKRLSKQSWGWWFETPSCSLWRHCNGIPWKGIHGSFCVNHWVKTLVVKYPHHMLKWSGGWGTGTVDWLSTSERDQYLDGCPAMNTKCLDPGTSIPARLDTLVYWEPFSWLTSVGATRNTVIRLGWSRIRLAVLILHAASVGLTDKPAVISGRFDKYHSLQLQNYYAHFPPLQHTHILAKHNYAELVMGMIMGFEALYAGRGRGNPVWSGKEAHWSLRGLTVKSAEHCGADYPSIDRYACHADQSVDFHMKGQRNCEYSP